MILDFQVIPYPGMGFVLELCWAIGNLSIRDPESSTPVHDGLRIVTFLCIGKPKKPHVAGMVISKHENVFPSILARA